MRWSERGKGIGGPGTGGSGGRWPTFAGARFPVLGKKIRGAADAADEGRQRSSLTPLSLLFDIILSFPLNFLAHRPRRLHPGHPGPGHGVHGAPTVAGPAAGAHVK